MNKKQLWFIGCFAVMVATIGSCKRDPNPSMLTPYVMQIPAGLPAMSIPATNPMTVEGVALGKKLFFDPILSANNTMSCASCHNQKFAFVDSNRRFSIGIDNIAGNRNAMPLFNLGYQKKFFWDGGAADLESQVIGPIENPVEMHENLGRLLTKLNAHAEYPTLFRKVFGGDTITTTMLMKAIAQYERTIVSGNSKYDQYKQGKVQLTAEELRGMEKFVNDSVGDCAHCHTMGGTFSSFEFRNNGVDSIYADAGRYKITLVGSDSGKFKTPSLRNIAITAPYMHDGRFTTLQQCLDHYNTGFHYGPNLDVIMSTNKKNRMTTQDMQDIIAFLKTLTDETLLTNPAFAKP